jgi:hypothetical protein
MTHSCRACAAREPPAGELDLVAVVEETPGRRSAADVAAAWRRCTRRDAGRPLARLELPPT